MVRIYRSEHVYPEPPQTPLLAYFIRYPNPFARHVLSVDVLDRWIDSRTGQLHTKRLILKRGIIPKWASKWLPASNMSGGRGLDAWILEESVVDPPGFGDDMVPDPTGEGMGGMGAMGGIGMMGGGMEAESSAHALRRARGEQRRDGDSGITNSQRQGGEGEEIGDSGQRSAAPSLPRLSFTQGNMNHRKFMHVIESGELCAGPNGTTLHRTQAEIKSDFGGAWSAMIRQRIESYAMGKFETNSEHSRKGMSLVMTRLRSRQPQPDTAEFYPPPPPQFGETWPGPARLAARSIIERTWGGGWFGTR